MKRAAPAVGRSGDATRWRGAALPAMPLAVTLLVLAVAYWAVDTTSPALPVMRDDLGIDATGAGLIVSLFFGGRLVANLPAALLVDRRGARLTTLAGALVLGVGSAMAAVAADEALLLPARALQGAGVAFLATAGLLSVLRAMPGGGSAMTAFNVSAGLGGSFGLLAGGYLTGAFGWRAIFWQCVLLAAVLVVASLAARPRPTAPADQADRAAPADPGPGAPLASPRAIGGLAANLLVYLNYAIWVVALPLYAATRFDASASDIGRLLLVLNTIHILGAFPARQVIRRFGPLRSFGIGMASVAVGMIAMILAPNPWALFVPMALYALGEIAGNSGAGEMLLRLGGGGGRAVGMVRVTSDVGMVVGPVVAGVLVDRSGVTAPFVALSALSLVAAAIALAPGRGRAAAMPA